MTNDDRSPISRLSPESRVELERRLLERRAQSTGPSRILPRNDLTDLAPASSAQTRLWFLDQFEPSSGQYIIPRAFRLRGVVDVAALKKALGRIVERHQSLRTVFETIDGVPYQRVDRASEVELRIFDLRGLNPERREVELRERLADEARRPMDLSTGPLVRVSLHRLEAFEHVLLLCVHHIVFDGWSMAVFFHELAASYDAELSGDDAGLPELPIQYADYALWQQSRRNDETTRKRRAYWKERLRGAPAVLDLPTDRPRPREQTFRGALQSWSLDRELVAGLRELGRHENVTLFMTLYAAFAVLLYRFSGQEDICIGSPSAGRTRLEVENLIGLFVNTLVLRLEVSAGATFRDILHRARGVALAAFDNQDVPFEQIVEDLLPERRLNASPLFQVMFALQSAPKATFRPRGVEVEPMDVHNGTSKFDLTLYVFEVGERLEATAEYNCDLFDDDTIGRLLEGFETLLEGITSDPDSPVSRLPVMKPAERERLVVDWNETDRTYDRMTTIDALFEAQIEHSPSSVAVVQDDRSLSYQELNRRANRLAHRLRRLGVGPDDLVGVYLERSVEMVVGVLGILKSGAAYVPLDWDYPCERLGFVVSDAELSVVVTESRFAASFPDGRAELVLVDPADGEEDESNPPQRSKPEHQAYVIYTSGSTGTPKGVLGLHRGTLNRLFWMWEAYPFEPGEVCCLKTSPNFVDSVAELFGSLLQGVSTVVIRDADVMDPNRLVRVLAEHEVTRIVIVPSLLRVLLDTQGALGEKLPRLRIWTCSGEALSVELLTRFRSAVPGARLLNLYGSSEISADATCFDATEESDATGSVPIGRPIANMRVYVLDEHLEPVPRGVPGEIYVAGVGVSSGYWHRPELTRERFLENRFDRERSPTMFKTGDRGRLRADGNLVFLGRTDHQIKIRGFRVEPGEVEHVLRQHPSVHEAVVVSREDDNEDKSLVAYVTFAGGRECAHEELREFVRKRLPEYMVPSRFVTLDELPLTPSGKIDRLALPEASPPRRSRGTVAPSTELERRMIALWEDLLGVRPVGIHDDFFELGGHSFLAMRLATRIQQELGGEVAVLDVFRAPTVHELVSCLGGNETSETAPASCVVPIQPRGSRPPFVFTGLGGGHLPRNLSRHLGRERPFYAMLSLEDMESESVNGMTVPEVAARYVSELRVMQPRGPYFLGAFCGQGIVGYEMARQLESQGEHVAFLGIFEAPAPGRRTVVERLRHIVRRDTLRAKSHWNNVKRLPVAGRVHYGLEMARSLTARLRQRSSRALEQLRYRWYVSAGRSLPDDLRRTWSVRASIRQKYTPEPLKARINSSWAGSLTTCRTTCRGGTRLRPAEWTCT